MGDFRPLASLDYSNGLLDDALRFLKRTRDELSELRMVRVWEHRILIFDVNHEAFEIRRLGYLDAEIVPVLDAVNAVFKKSAIHAPAPGEFKEFKTGRRYPWAADRVM